MPSQNAPAAVPAPIDAPERPALAPAPLPARMGWGRRTVAFLFVLVVAAMVVVSLLPRGEPPVEVQLALARKGSITRLVTAAGKLQAATEVKLSSNISGDLLELRVQEGDRVARGQVLGRIDSRRYDEQVRQQEALRASAAADARLERVRVDQLRSELARVERLASGGNASEAELDTARSGLNVELARQAAAEQKVSQAEAALREARHWQSLTTLTSPMDGVVTKREKQVGERVRGSDFSEDVILVISTLSKMEVKVEVGEHEVIYVKEGDPAEIEIDAMPDRKFPAQVVEVARNATVKNAGTEAEVTTFFVRLALTEQVSGALPGMSGQASISTDTRDEAVVVPIQAVTVRTEQQLARKVGGAASDGPPTQGPLPPGKKARRDPMRKVVFVMEDGVARVRPVETGLASDTEIEIVSGLSAGEKVVEGPYRVLSRELEDGKRLAEKKPGEPGQKG
ncbi:MAG TPA: efflux RND transporter periplasmic adaptor subunit [Anaeromyxobacteraceae bacterium]|nr:efflux RND transporter periplasmic adaptor subunit [Anaeromyxobacteraceae bacterium]